MGYPRRAVEATKIGKTSGTDLTFVCDWYEDLGA